MRRADGRVFTIPRLPTWGSRARRAWGKVQAARREREGGRESTKYSPDTQTPGGSDQKGKADALKTRIGGIRGAWSWSSEFQDPQRLLHTNAPVEEEREEEWSGVEEEKVVVVYMKQICRERELKKGKWSSLWSSEDWRLDMSPWSPRTRFLPLFFWTHITATPQTRSPGFTHPIHTCDCGAAL